MSYPTFRLPMGIVFYQTSSRATYKSIKLHHALLINIVCSACYVCEEWNRVAGACNVSFAVAHASKYNLLTTILLSQRLYHLLQGRL